MLAKATRFLFALATLSACAPSAVVRVNPRPAEPPVQRVALVPFDDYPGSPGSGRLVTAAFARQLATAGYVLTRGRAGADAVVEGSLTEFSEERPLVVFEYPAPQPTDPRAFAPSFSIQDVRGKTALIVSGGIFMDVPPHEPVVAQWESARVGVRARMTLPATGEELWSAVSSSHPSTLQAGLDYTYRMTAEDAADQACGAIVKAVAKKRRATAGAPAGSAAGS